MEYLKQIAIARMAPQYEDESNEFEGETTTTEDTEYTYTLQGKKYYIVGKRWTILALICLILLPDMFSFSFFAFINDLTSFYFDIPPAVTDVQATINLIGRMFSTIIVCFIGNLMSFRSITILGSALNALSAILVAIGVIYGLFSLVLFGMFVSGLGAAIVMALIQLVAVIWFPFRERGKANAAMWVARRTSYLFSSLISTRSMGIDYSYTELEEIEINDGNETAKIDLKFKAACSSTFGGLALMSIVCCLIAQFFLPEHPPLCESTQATNDPGENSDESTPMLGEKPKYSFKKELKEIGELFSNPSFILIFLIYSFMMTERPLGSTLTSSLILAQFPDTNDQFVGIMLVIGIVLASIFSPITGVLLDKLTKPRLIYICIMIVSITGVIAFSVCFQVSSLTGVFASFLILWSTRDGVLVCMTHRLSAILSNKPNSSRIKGYTLPSAGTAICGAIATTCIRILLENVNSSAAVLFPLPFLLFGLFSYIFLWQYLRDPK